MATALQMPPVRAQVSAAEWALRQDLACAYRLVASLGWDDLNFTHISARVPGEAAFLLNPYDLGFEEITASSLIKLDFNGRVLIDNGMGMNQAGFTIHSALLSGRADVNAVIHLHTIAGTAVSMMACGLLPASQAAASVTHELAYHDYEGIAVDLDERERLIEHMGAANVMILRNHGTLAVGGTIPEAFTRIYFLERACEMQVAALSSVGREGLVTPADAATRQVGEVNDRMGAMVANRIVWPLMRRRMERLDAGFLE
ncbi:MAG: class II aldolase/adducin family protein [Sphingomonadaceae bacterium]|nr:class II aldolase/adducin family protein [Sphingomonadaceae bacterium]